MREKGHQVFFYDAAMPYESFRALSEFFEPGQTAAFAFNFNGMMNDPCLCEDREPVFFNATGMPLINMVVDHPYYYHEVLPHIPRNYTQLSIDKNHLRYMKRFFPGVDASHYLELGGTKLKAVPEVRNAFGLIPVKARKTDVVFTGNYVEPASYDEHIAHLDPEVQNFYHELFWELITHTDETLEAVAERKIRSVFSDVEDEYLKKCFAQMIFLDLKARHYFRGKAVRALTDHGIRVSVFGSGYEKLQLKKPENLLIHGNVNSERCLQEIGNAKLSLNVMPWFKDGAHDRVYNSMLNGAVSLTDPSKALRRHFTDDEIAFYSLNDMESLAEKAQKLLSNPALMQDMADAAYENALQNHTWKRRADTIEGILSDKLGLP